MTAEHRAAPEKGTPRRSWSLWLGILISLGCLIWAVFSVDWAAVINALASANWLWVGLGVATVLATIATRLARWAMLLRPRRIRPSSLLAAMLVGQLLNYFAPARAGDLARAYLLGQTEGKSKAWVLGTVALEKLWDMWALLSVVAVLSGFGALPVWLSSTTRWLAVFAALALIGTWMALRYQRPTVLFVARLGRRLPSRVGAHLHGIINRLLDGLDGLRRPHVWLWAAVWTAATWGMGALTNHTILRAMGLSLPLSASLLLLVVLQAGVAVPSVPGRVGVFEGLCIVTLGLYRVDQETALAVGLALHAVVFLPPITLGLYYAWRARERGARGV